MPTPATVSAPQPADATRSPLPPAPPSRSAPSTRDGQSVSPPCNDIRNDIGTTPCPACATAFTPVRRQRYCTPACRQRAWRARHPAAQTPPAVAPPPAAPRRAITVYRCPGCDVRHLGRQWCDDCNRPCTRVDYGGLCPACDQPVAISDLTGRHPATK